MLDTEAGRRTQTAARFLIDEKIAAFDFIH
jgi:hypothetical protein